MICRKIFFKYIHEQTRQIGKKEKVGTNFKVYSWNSRLLFEMQQANASHLKKKSGIDMKLLIGGLTKVNIIANF